ncbi:MAG: hypothetical protein JWN30_247 [Bacilli bacterium]|nr:hypothetical protein [Bacilli bacterium]
MLFIVQVFLPPTELLADKGITAAGVTFACNLSARCSDGFFPTGAPAAVTAFSLLNLRLFLMPRLYLSVPK